MQYKQRKWQNATRKRNFATETKEQTKLACVKCCYKVFVLKHNSYNETTENIGKQRGQHQSKRLRELPVLRIMPKHRQTPKRRSAVVNVYKS